MQRKHPCSQHCPERSATCHTTCERYREHYTKSRADYEAKSKAAEADMNLTDYIVRQCYKNQKQKPNFRRKTHRT